VSAVWGTFQPSVVMYTNTWTSKNNVT